MGTDRRYGDLEIIQDARLEEAVWSWQRAMWLVMAATLALALLGLFGGGLIGRATVRDPQGRLTVDYPRFSRREGQTTLEIEYRPGPRGASRVWLNREYLDDAGVEQVSPTPENEVANAAGTTYVVGSASGDRPVRLRFRLNPERPGLLRGRVRLDDGPEVGFTQVVYP